MPHFHHVNLGVPPEEMEREMAFLTDVLGYTRLPIDERLGGLGARWFEGEDGAQVHLSADPEHRPADRAHVAVTFGPDLAGVEQRLTDAGIEFQASQREGFPRIAICRDPAGNRWELRGH